MDILPDILNDWLLNYGSIALFGLLALGIIALPIPEETLLIFSGILICKGTFAWIPTVLSAYLGSMTGITLSYFIGLTGGHYFIKKYGGYVGISEKKMDLAHNWFEKYGKWMLFVGYFIPGVRHFTGIFAGISSLEYSHFAIFAYTGAFFWVMTFLMLGYFFGNWQQEAFELVEKNMEIILTSIILAIGLAIYLNVRKKKL